MSNTSILATLAILVLYCSWAGWLHHQDQQLLNRPVMQQCMKDLVTHDYGLEIVSHHEAYRICEWAHSNS